MKRPVGFLVAFLLVATASAEVRVFVQESNTLAWVRYECTAGEVVRAFALDVSVSQGRIMGISDFFRGPSTGVAQGYGIFPAAFRDHITNGPGSNIDWNVSGYTPLAVAADDPANTLPGLDSSGVTLAFGGLWDPNVPAAVPGPTGTLCSLRISKGATVSVKPNLGRGGVVAAETDVILDPGFTAAFVQPPEITGLSVTHGLITIAFAGGELYTAPAITGPWTGSGNVSGQFTDLIGNQSMKFYRVRSP